VAILALSFQQELIKAVVSAVAGALAVTAFGYVAVEAWGRRRERRDEEAQRRQQAARDEYELRSSMIESCARTASVMWIACQYQARAGRFGWALVRWPQRLFHLEGTGPNLHAAYVAFNVESKVLETLLEVRYEPAEWVIRGERGSEEVNKDLDPATRWHLIADLLTIYYFCLLGRFYGDSLKTNTLGHGGRLHSGLRSEHQPDTPHPSRQQLREVQDRVRDAYQAALPAVELALLQAPLRKIGGEPRL
jgi:hypothetical protein